MKLDELNDSININGIVNGKTDKALLIQFSSDKEYWIPKSTIHCEYDYSDKEQKFIIDEWVLKKNQIL